MVAIAAGVVPSAVAACVGDPVATADVQGRSYSVSVVRGLEVADADLTPYATFRTDAGAYFADRQALEIRDVDPLTFLVARAPSGLEDDAGSLGPLMGLLGQGHDADLCRYFTRLAPDWCVNLAPSTDQPSTAEPAASVAAAPTELDGLALHTVADWDGLCHMGVGVDLILRGSASDPARAWGVDGPTGQRTELAWPDGYVAQFRPSLQIVDSTGTVVAHEGDRIIGTCVPMSQQSLQEPLWIGPSDVRPSTWQPGDG